MSDYRLPKTIWPSNYRIILDATPKRASFSGTVEIDMKLDTAVESIDLHGRGLKVSAASVVQGKAKQKAKVKLSKEHETITLALPKPLKKGKAVVTLAYTGTLDKAMHGLYLAKDGSDRALVSQCEASDARAIFPSFDEPEFKATLQWTVVTDPGLSVITNGVLARTQKKGGRVVHAFKKTKVVSTYLAAVTIGQYDISKPERIAGIAHRVVTSPGKLAQAEFAKEVTRYVLPWYEKYFGQKYNYQKLDQVGVAGFDAGAMENIGAIFYRQSRFLMQPGQTSWATQKAIAEVVAHEIAHQWFGNRVTMKWWDDLWLNEAFATWIAFKTIALWKPEWRLWDDYQEGKERALFADALVNTHPIYSEVKSPAEATELFDVITYEKGGSVLRMLEQYLGEKAFQKGIARYMEAFKDKNASGSDLWLKLQEASKQPVSALMSSWVNQPGFPLLSVAVDQSGAKTVLTFTQKRFFSGREEMEKENAQRWAIPVVVRYSVDGKLKEKRLLIEDEETIVTLEDFADWVYPNAQAIGFYRLELSGDALQALLQHGLKGLLPAERLGLIEDQWALVRNGRATVAQFFDVLLAMKGESDYVVLQAMAGRLRLVDMRLVDDNARPKFRSLVKALFAEPLQRLGYVVRPKEKTEIAVARATLIDALGRLAEDSEVLSFANTASEQERQDPASIEPNLAGIVVSLAAKAGDEKRLKTYVGEYLARKKAKASPELQGRYLSALTSFQQGDLARSVLELCLDGTVPQEQLRLVIAPLLSERRTSRTAWTFLKQHWAEIGPRVGAMGVGRLVEATGALPPELADDVEKFFTENRVEEAARALKKALEAMALNRDLVKRETARASAWLEKFVE